MSEYKRGFDEGYKMALSHIRENVTLACSAFFRNGIPQVDDLSEMLKAAASETEPDPDTVSCSGCQCPVDVTIDAHLRREDGSIRCHHCCPVFAVAKAEADG